MQLGAGCLRPNSDPGGRDALVANPHAPRWRRGRLPETLGSISLAAACFLPISSHLVSSHLISSLRILDLLLLLLPLLVVCLEPLNTSRASYLPSAILIDTLDTLDEAGKVRRVESEGERARFASAKRSGPTPLSVICGGMEEKKRESSSSSS